MQKLKKTIQQTEQKLRKHGCKLQPYDPIESEANNL